MYDNLIVVIYILCLWVIALSMDGFQLLIWFFKKIIFKLRLTSQR